MREIQEVIISIPLDLFGWSYKCEKCGCDIHISRHDPHPAGPTTTHRKCPNCGIKIKLIWVHEAT